MGYDVEQMRQAAQRGLRATDYHREVKLAEMVLQLLGNGGRFSEYPDPPCVHCGEDTKELTHLRSEVARLELANFELKVKVDKLQTTADENGALLLILQQQLSAEGIEPGNLELPSAYEWSEDGRWGVMQTKQGTVYWCPDCGRQSLMPVKHWPGCKRDETKSNEPSKDGPA